MLPHTAPSITRFYIVLLVTGLALLAFVLAVTPQIPLSPRPPQAVNAPSIPAIPLSERVLLRDRTLTAGLLAVHRQGGETLNGLDESLGAGVCAFDYDADGWIDLFIIGGSGQSRYYGRSEWWQMPHGSVLYRNQGGRFRDVTQESGILHTGWGMGCLAADLDNDSDQDLFFTNVGRNTLWRNNGDGTFTDVTRETGITGDQWSTSAAVADYDGDGLLDIYVVNYLKFHKGYRTYEPLSEFRSDLPPQFDPRLYDSAPNQVLRNLGGLRFEDATEATGLADPSGRGLAAIWSDLNGDGRPDLIVANDANTPNAVFINQGGGRFVNDTRRLGLHVAEATAGVVAGDIDNDGDMDVAMSTGIGLPPQLFINSDSPMAYRSVGSAKSTVFKDLAREIGVGDESIAGYHGWGLGLADLDNDGWLDLYLANGQRTPDRLAPRISQGQLDHFWLNPATSPRYGREASRPIPLADAAPSRGVALADFDNDGDMDAFVTRNNDLGQLLMNESPPRHWLGLQLIGETCNRDAVGAKIVLRTAQGIQTREVGRGRGFLSSTALRLHFGLGQIETVQTLTVYWPDSTRTAFHNPPIDTYLVIRQDSAKLETVPATIAMSDPVLRLAVGREDPKLRVRYLEHVAEIESVMGGRSELEAALTDESELVRRRATELLGELRTPAALALLTTAMEDPSPTVRAAAVQAIYGYEEEMAVRWLLRALEDPSTVVRCLAAEAFGFYFREEEALVVRKYLAVPGLIRMLNAPDPKARVCAARALGDAEHFRGIQPLIARLTDPQAMVRAEAARALGLIRHQTAVPPLRSRLELATEVPTVRAQALIALQRLNVLEPNKMLTGLLDTTGQGDGSIQRTTGVLKTLLAVIRSRDDGVVIPPQLVSDTVLAWFHGLAPSAVASPEYASGIRTVLDIARTVQDRNALSVARNLASHPDPALRAGAYQALLTLSRPGAAIGYAEQGLRDPAPQVRSLVLDQLLLRIDTPVSVDLLTSALAEKALKSRALRLLGRDPSKAAEAALLTSFEEAQPGPEAQIAVGNAMATGEPIVDERARDEIRLAGLECWVDRNTKRRFAQPPSILTQALHDRSPEVRTAAWIAMAQRDERWATELLWQRLIDTREPESVREQVVTALGRRGTPTARTLLYRLAQLRHDPISDTVLAWLSVAKEGRAKRLLWRVLDNPHERPGARMSAASTLIASDPGRVLAVLRGENWIAKR